MKISTKARTLIGVVAASLAAGAAISATTWADQSTPAPDATVAAAPASGPQAYGVFRRAAQSGDSMPPEVRRMLTPFAEQENLSLDNARAVAPSGVSAVWAIPGAGQVCLALPDPVDGFGLSCRTYDQTASMGLWVALVGGPDQRLGDATVAFFVPDGVATVTAVSKGGSRQTLTVTDNTAVAQLSNADQIQYTDSAGVTHSARIPSTTPATQQ